jgi:hypothetical protein
MTVLPSGRGRRWSLPGRAVLVAVVLVGAVAAVVVAHPWAQSSNTSAAAAVSQASYQMTANAKCAADYQSALPHVRAAGSDTATLIALSEALGQRLSSDVSAVAHPATDDAKLGAVHAATAEVVEYLKATGPGLATSASSVAAAQKPVTDLRNAYLALGLDQCVDPNIPGAPRL